MNLILVFLGGGTGAIARYLAGVGYVRSAGAAQSYLATLGINVFGGLLMGLLAAWLALRGGGAGEPWRLLLGVGVLGGFTTFSTFSLEALSMIERRAYGVAATYVLASASLAIGGVAVGLMAGRRLFA